MCKIRKNFLIAALIFTIFGECRGELISNKEKPFIRLVCDGFIVENGKTIKNDISLLLYQGKDLTRLSPWAMVEQATYFDEGDEWHLNISNNYYIFKTSTPKGYLEAKVNRQNGKFFGNIVNNNIISYKIEMKCASNHDKLDALPIM